MGKKVWTADNGQWALIDTVDNTLWGDDDGPKVYTDYMVARVAAQMVDVQVGFAPGRTRVTPYVAAPKVKRDEVVAKYDPETALKRLEEGRWT